jgi:16S rRNA (uracil1498-N3)-methyltransferase
VISLLVSPADFDGATLRVEGEPYRHLFRARRLEQGERLRLVDGRGRARWGEVVRIDRAAAAVALGEPAPANEPARRLVLVTATLRPERASWLVEKATELGVAAVRFLHTARAPRTFGDGTVERLRRVAAAAVEQCHRALCPEVTGTHEWRELAGLVEGSVLRRVLDTEAAGGPSDGLAAEETDPLAPAALLVGPEGGWSPEEREELAAAGWHSLSLGSRTLRAETAAVVGVAGLL